MALYRPLTEAELDGIAAGVALAGELLGVERPPRIEDLQALYDALLDEPVKNAAAVDALGYAFGNLFLECDWLHWAMMLDDEYGDEISIAVEDRALGCSPLSMIRNRLEDQEAWKLAELLEETVSRLRQLGQRASLP